MVHSNLIGGRENMQIYECIMHHQPPASWPKVRPEWWCWMKGSPSSMHDNTYINVETQRCLGPNFINALPTRSKLKLLRRQRAGRERVKFERDGWKILHKTDKREWHLIISILTVISSKQIGTIKNEQTCWPRQMRGPALKGRKINEFATRYFLTRSSRKRSG